MRRSICWLGFIGLLLLASTAWSQEEVSGGEAAEGEWPGVVVSAGMTYSPAPYLTYEYSEFEPWANLHLLDQMGPQVTMEWRLNRFLQMGFYTEVFANQGSVVAGTGYRISPIFPSGPIWSFYLVGTTGLAYWRTNSDDCFTRTEVEFAGAQVGIGAGSRVHLGKHLGLFFEMNGTATVFSRIVENETWREDTNAYLMFRLLFVIGACFGW